MEICRYVLAFACNIFHFFACAFYSEVNAFLVHKAYGKSNITMSLLRWQWQEQRAQATNPKTKLIKQNTLIEIIFKLQSLFCRGSKGSERKSKVETSRRIIKSFCHGARSTCKITKSVDYSLMSLDGSSAQHMKIIGSNGAEENEERNKNRII